MAAAAVADEAVYGSPPPELAAAGPGAAQTSPLVPGAAPIEAIADASLARFVVQAPPGALERRFVLAHALRALAPGGELIALAPKMRGGLRIADELAALGCTPHESARRHHRIVRAERPEHPKDLAEAIAAGAAQIAPALGLWSQPGVFSWNRLDPGTALLLESLPALAGRGADLGCGVGVLGARVLASQRVTELSLIDIDRRSVDAARRNIADPRALFLWRDARGAAADLDGLDFVVMNPPFHHAGEENRGLGLAFIAAAAAMLRRGGVCRLVANVALPYEARIAAEFARSRVVAHGGGYRVHEAVK